ncbi:ragulator complex protein LAMTOR5-like [Argonauta hians]
MESHMNKVLTEVGENPEVTGVICTDQHGLCLGVKGNMSPCHAGLITSLAHCGRSLRQDETHSPVITMESEGGQILMLKSTENVSFGIMKTAPQSWH